MPTILQRRLARKIIENEKRTDPVNKTVLIESAGYSGVTAIGNQERTIEQKGVKIALKEYGFTEDNAKKVVSKILNAGKEENRLRAADLVFKVEGSYAPVKTTNLNAEIKLNELSDEELMEIAYPRVSDAKERINEANEAVEGS